MVVFGYEPSLRTTASTGLATLKLLLDREKFPRVASVEYRVVKSIGDENRPGEEWKDAMRQEFEDAGVALRIVSI